MFHRKHFRYLIVSFFILVLTFFMYSETVVQASSSDYYGFVLLTCYQKELSIGDSFYLGAIASNGKRVTYSSSSSTIASVNTYGKVTAKKAGTAVIRAKSKNGEASCKVTVEKTTITLNEKRLSLENGETASLTATTSNGSAVKWKSKKSSIASVSEDGVVTAKKPGDTTITATADGTTVTCRVYVKKPKVTLSPSKITLYRKGTKTLAMTSTSATPPKWKSNRRSVAVVDENGTVTAMKHGTALITVTVDGVSKICEVIVEQPEVTLNNTELAMTEGETFTLRAKVSSGNKPEWSSSNTAVATVNSRGIVTAHQSGKAYIYAAEDGVKARCTIKVSEAE